MLKLGIIKNAKLVQNDSSRFESRFSYLEIKDTKLNNKQNTIVMKMK